MISIEDAECEGHALTSKTGRTVDPVVLENKESLSMKLITCEFHLGQFRAF
jgi:hypothetical protein